MKQLFCPRCRSFRIEIRADGNIICNDCGYVGQSQIDKEIKKEF